MLRDASQRKRCDAPQHEDRWIDAYTLTSGTLGTEPRGGGPPSPLGPDGLRRGGRRLGLAPTGCGIFSGFGVTGPSRYSKPSFSAPFSSLTAMTRTWPPALSLPNKTS